MILAYGVFIVAIIVFLGELGMPTGIPIEVGLLLTGALAVQSVPELAFAILLVTAADVAGGGTLYLVSRTGGVRLLDRVLRRFGRRSEEIIARWQQRLGGRDVAVVAVGRSLPLVRMYVSIGSGLLRLRPRDFLLGAVPGALLWSGVPILLGYLFRTNVNQLAAEYARISAWGFAVMPAFSLVVAVGWWIKRGHSGWVRLQRGRMVVSLVIAGAATAFLVRIIALHGAALGAGMAAIGRPLLTPWALLLAGFAAALLNAALGDLRGALRQRKAQPPVVHLAVVELAATVVWASLVLAVGVLMLSIHLHYPVL
ncbi:MAG: DedA family protein [Sphaerobacter sp.]|nr:DedA family protein [Sphaerobacter sp.]